MGRPPTYSSIRVVTVLGTAFVTVVCAVVSLVIVHIQLHSTEVCYCPSVWPFSALITLLCSVVTVVVYLLRFEMRRAKGATGSESHATSSVRTTRVTRQTVTTIKGSDGQVVSTVTTTESPSYQSSARCRRHLEPHSPAEVKRTKRVVKTQVRTTGKISDIITGQSNENLSAREVLLRWAQRTTDCYPSVKVTDFTTSWKDGLAFNAIIHRNRPELIEFRSLQGKSPRENLELAFSIAEKEFGVTRLLDPEDVDTPEPDEKSLITYISSLYDIFSEPPPLNPYADEEKFHKITEYKEMANVLYIWIQESTIMLQNRNFPNSLMDMKALLSECSRFRSEDVPPKLRNKQRIGHLHREIQKIFKEIHLIQIEDSLKFDNIEHLWNKMIIAHQERDQAIRAEITRLEKLQRLSEKIQRDIKKCQTKLNEVEKRIPEEEKKLNRLHPMDAKNLCDHIEAELKILEENMKSILKDVKTLFENDHPQAPELQQRTQELHEQWVSIRLIFQTQLLQPLSTRSFKVEERKITKQRHVVSEQRVVETTKSLQVLQDTVDVMNSKLNHLNEISCGNDLNSIQSCLDQLKNEQRILDQYKKKLDQYRAQKSQVKDDEQELYCTLLIQMENIYTQLTIVYERRLVEMTSLLEFAQLVNNELKWIGEKEKTEINRDWSAKNLNIVQTEQHLEVLTTELEKRELQFNDIQRKGETLLAQDHQASKTIKTFLTTLQTQWSWLLQLLVCLESHLKYASAYHQFMKEAQECDQWLKRTENKLNSTYSKQNFSIDEGERLLKEMQQLRTDLQHYGDIITSLINRSSTIVPLKQRNQSITSSTTVIAVCSYKQQNINITQDERFQLLDNSRKTKWKVRNSSGVEGLVPSVCFVIPPPNIEAINLAENLQKQYISVVNLGTIKQQKLRQHLIFATIKVVKSWTVTQFRNMEISQRESILKALNEDAQILLSEGSQDDPNLKRLQEEMKSCNKIIEDLQQKVTSEEYDKPSKKGSQKLPEMQATLLSKITEKEKLLKSKLQAPIPCNLDNLENLVIQHKEFETSLRNLEQEISEMKHIYASLNRKTPTLQTKHDNIIQIWENIWSMSNQYVERLKLVEIVLHGFEETTQIISSFEIQLASHDNLPSEIDSLQKIHSQILSMQSDMQNSQYTVDRLNEDINTLKQLVQKTRIKQTSNTDINKLINDIHKITERWNNASSQVVERMRSCEASSELLRTYKNKLENENSWIIDTRQKINSLRSVNSVSGKDAEKELDSALNIYTSLANKKPSLENTNIVGGRFIREAKIYDLRLKHYKDSLEEVHPSLDASLSKKAKLTSGANNVSQELDNLNQQYKDLVNAILDYINGLKDVLTRHGSKVSVTITKTVPLTLKTFHHVLEQTISPEPMEVDNVNIPISDIVMAEQQSVTDSKYEQMPSQESSLVEKYTTSSVVVKEFKAVKSTRKSDDSFINMKGILNTKTGEMLPLSDAIDEGIINLEKRQYIDPRTGKEMDFKEAANKNYIDKKFSSQLLSLCGIINPKTKTEITLIEAIYYNIYDVDKGVFLNPDNGDVITLDEAISLGIVQKDKINYLSELRVIKITDLTIIEAVNEGLLDEKTGLFKDPISQKVMTLPEAFNKGLLRVPSSDERKTGYLISEFIDNGMIDEYSGQIIDEDSGEKITIDEALPQNLIRADVREVMNTETGELVTVPEAISLGIINIQTGRFIDKKTMTKMTLIEARKKNLIFSPLNLKTAYEQNLLDTSGKIIDPFTGRKLTVLEAVTRGLLNSEMKCIILSKTGELVTLPEAFSKGILTPEGIFTDTNTGETMTLHECANKGLVASVKYQSIFDIEGILIPSSGEQVSFNTAVSKGIINTNTGKFKKSPHKYITLEEALKEKLIQPQIYNMLTKDIEIKDEKGNKLNVIRAVTKGILDHKTGKLREPRTKKPLTLKDAIEKGVITPQGAAHLKALLNIVVTTAVVTKTVTKVIPSDQEIDSEVKITFQDAMKEGLINETEGTFKNPITGEILPLEEAINTGLLGLTSQWPVTSEDTVSFTQSATVVSESQTKKETEKSPVLKKKPSQKDMPSEKSKLPKSIDKKVPVTIMTVIPSSKETFVTNIQPKPNIDEKDFTSTISTETQFITEVENNKNLLIQTKETTISSQPKELKSPVSGIPSKIPGKEKPAAKSPSSRKLPDTSTNEEKISENITEKKPSKVPVSKTSEPSTVDNFQPKQTAGVITNDVINEVTKKETLESTKEVLSEKIIREIPQTISDSIVQSEEEIKLPESPTQIKKLPETIPKEGRPQEVDKLIQPSKSNIPKSQKSTSPVREMPQPSKIKSNDDEKEPLKHPKAIQKPSARPGSPKKEQMITSEQEYFEKITDKKTIKQIDIGDVDSDITQQTNVLELPADGWSLKEAIAQNLFDGTSGLFTIPGTDRLVSFEETIKMGIINPKSASVVEPGSKRTITLLRSLEKGILDSTGHYHDNKRSRTVTLNDAIKEKLIKFEDEEIQNEPYKKGTKIIKIESNIDNLQMKEIQPRQTIITTSTPEFKKSEIIINETYEFVEISPNIYFDKKHGIILKKDTNEKIKLSTAIKNNIIDIKLFKVKDVTKDDMISLNDGVKRGFVNIQKGTFTNTKTKKQMSLEDAAKIDYLICKGLITTISQDYETPQVFQSITKQSTVQTPIVQTEIRETTVIYINDPRTGEKLTLEDAVKKGIIKAEVAKKLQESQDLPTTLKEEDVVNGVSTIEIEKSSKSPKSQRKVISEPRFEVTFGKATTLQSPDKEQVVLQKVRRRAISPKTAVNEGLIDQPTVEIINSIESMRNENNEPITLDEALKKQFINGNEGVLIDPRKGEKLTIKEAVNSGLLDPESSKLLIPIGRSLSLSEVVSQGLVIPSEKRIIHPETGDLLTLQDAITCDIVNPVSTVCPPTMKKPLTLEEAIKRKIVDDITGDVQFENKKINIVEAAQNLKLFDKSSNADKCSLPMLAITFPVALRHNLIDVDKKEFIHPVTGTRTPVDNSIDKGLIMTLPFSPSSDSINVTEAMDKKLIDSEKCVMKHPNFEKEIPIFEAVESGILQMTDFNVPETSELVTNLTTATCHTVIESQTIKTSPGFTMCGPNQVVNTETGEVMTVEEANKRGIIKIETETRRVTSPLSFSEALERGFIDLDDCTYTDVINGRIIPISQAISEELIVPKKEVQTEDIEKYTISQLIDLLYDENSGKFREPKTNKLLTLEEMLKKDLIDLDSVIYDVHSGKSLTTKQAIDSGKLDIKHGNVLESDSGNKIPLKDAFKLGIIAVIGAPLLAGAVVAGSLKNIIQNKNSKPDLSHKIPFSTSKHSTSSQETRKIISTQTVQQKGEVQTTRKTSSEVQVTRKISSEDRSKSPEKELSPERRETHKEKPVQDKKKRPDNLPKEKKPSPDEKRLPSPTKEQEDRKQPDSVKVRKKEVVVERKIIHDKIEDEDKPVKKSPERTHPQRHSPEREIPRKKPSSPSKEISKPKDDISFDYELNKISSPTRKTTREVHTTVITERTSSDLDQRKSQSPVRPDTLFTETDKDFSRIITTDKSIKGKSIETKEIGFPKKDSPKQTKPEESKFESTDVNVIDRKETVVRTQKHVTTEKSPTREYTLPSETVIKSTVEKVEISGKRASPTKEIESRRSTSPIKETEKPKIKHETDQRRVVVEEHVTIIDKKTKERSDTSPKREIRKTVTIETSDKSEPFTVKKEKAEYIFEKGTHEEKPKSPTKLSPETSPTRIKEPKKIDEVSKTVEKETYKGKPKPTKTEKSPERPVSLMKGFTKPEEFTQISKKEITTKDHEIRSVTKETSRIETKQVVEKGVKTPTDKKGVSPDLPKTKSLQEIPKSPVKEYPEKSGPKSPVKEHPEKTGPKSPVKEYPEKPSSKSPVREYPEKTGPKSPVKEYPEKPSSKSPVREYPEKPSSKSPVKEYPEKPSSKSPVREYPEKTGPKSPVKEYPEKPSSKSPVREYPEKTSPTSKGKTVSPTRKSPEKSASKEIDLISRQKPSMNGESTIIQSVTVFQGPTVFTSTTSTKKSATVERSGLKEVVGIPGKEDKIPYTDGDRDKWQVVPQQQTVTTSTTTVPGPALTKKEFNVTRREVIVTETYTEYRKEYDISQVLGKCVPLNKLIEHNVINPETCEFVIPRTNKKYKLQEALSRNIVSSDTIVKVISDKEISLAETVVEEKYRTLEENISELITWVEETELLLADLGHLKEDTGHLKQQINISKTIKNNLDDNQINVTTCLDQINQLVQQGKDILSKDEIQQLQKDGDILKKRYNNLCNECDKIIRRLSTALEELQKFQTEIQNFMQWLSDCQQTLTQKERGLGNLNKLKDNIESFRVFANDVIAHQADLRFITMATQKFIDESKEYLIILNAFRTNLPKRLSHLEPGESEMKVRVQEISSIYQTLLNRVTKLSDSLTNIESKQRFYLESVEKIHIWIQDIQRNANKLLKEPIGADSKNLQEQLDHIKQLSMEVVGQGRTIENIKHSAKAFLESLVGIEVQHSDIRAIETSVTTIEESFNRLITDVNERCDQLQTTLVQSQDIQDGLDQFAKWIEETENAFRNQNKPVSISRDKLQEQIIEYKMIQSDVNSQKSTIDALNSSAQKLVESSNQKLVKKIEAKLKDILNRFDKLSDKVSKRGELLEEIRTIVETVEENIVKFEQWLVIVVEKLESIETHRVVITEYITSIDEISNEKNVKKEEYDDVIRSCKNLLNKKDITDTMQMKEKLKSLEQQWKTLTDNITQKRNQGKAQTEQLSTYESLRTKVIEWLSAIEIKLENLEPVAIDSSQLQKQEQELKPLVKEHTDHAQIIQKVNDCGNTYDDMVQGEISQRKPGSPFKKVPSTSAVGSPIKKSPPKARKSPTSPTKAGSTQSPLSSISSGFSSRRSSVDNFGLEDLSPIQQQLMEINNRYNLLGVKLTDRQQEINTLTEELKQLLQILKTVTVFIQTQTKQLPKESTVTTKDQAEKQLQILKNIQNQMQEKQSDIDHLKIQTTELLKKRFNAVGASNLQEQVNEIVTKWTEVQCIIKERLDFLQHVKDFQDLYTTLINWLSQKDKMFQVLGPIATEPRMVTSQTQQVQVLQDEFISQQSVFEQFKCTGELIISKIGDNITISKKIQEQITTTCSRWENLQTQLTERQKNLDAAGDITKDFHTRIIKLQESLQKISDDFDTTVEGSADTEDQLKKLNNLEDRLENTRHSLADVERVCEQLCEILCDSASRNEIKNKLNNMEKQYTTILKKINNRKAELESTLKEDKKFFTSCDNIQRWLNVKDDSLSSEFPVSAEQKTLKQQIQEFEPIYKEVSDKEHEVHLLISKGTEVISKISRKPEALQLRAKLDGIKKQWEKIRKISTDRHTRLQRCFDNCKKFISAYESFIPWLEGSEKKLSTLQNISFQRTELDKQIREIQAFKNDISKHSQEFDNICNLSDTLVSSCDIDKEPMKDKIAFLRKRWDKLNQQIANRSQILDVVSQRLTEYYDKLRDIQHSLQRLDDKLSSHDALGDAAREPRHLERMKSFIVEADDIQKQINSLKDYVKKLLVEGTSSSNITHITKEVETVEKHYQSTNKKLQTRLNDLEAASEILLKFTNKVKTIQTQLNTLEESLDTMGSIGRDINTVRAQFDEIKNFAKQISKTRIEINDTQKVITQGRYNIEEKVYKDQISNIQRQLNRLDDRSKVYHTDLEKTLKRLEQFYKDYATTIKDLENLISEEKNFKSVGGDVETVRSQQQQFKTLCQKKIEPLKKNIEEVNKGGQGLIQSASSGISTTGLEQDLEKLNEKWNTLNEKLNDRERRLDVALIQSGKFQEALDGVQKWIHDTEEMVFNQKAPSADYKVVKAQAQEQKFLRKLLLDRQNSICSLQTMGSDILEQSQDTDVNQQLTTLLQKFNTLTSKAQERMDCLDNTIPVARDFQEKLTVLTEWIEIVEKRIVTLSTVPTDQDRLKINIVEHKTLEKEIIEHDKFFDELKNLSLKLKSLVGIDEANNVEERLKEVIERFEMVIKDNKIIGQILTDVCDGLGKFTVKYQKIIAWIEKMNTRLSHYEILNVYVDKLQEQLNELKKLKDDINDHEDEVQDTINSGRDIMKHASGDDAIEMKEKLDTLQIKFTDLVNRVNDKLRQAENALPLVEKFHFSHDQLTNWMEEAEKLLKGLETTSLSIQETTIKNLESEIQEYRTVLETVNHIGSKLCQLSPGSEAATIENLVSQNNRRFDVICEQVQRKGERITLSKQRNLEVVGDIEELLKWFEEIEKQLIECEPLVPELDTLVTLLKEQKSLNEEVSSQKGRAKDILATAKKVMRESSTDDLTIIRDKADNLKETCGVVSTLCSERLGALEQAVPLAEHFFETHAELSQWMDEIEAEAELLEAPIMNSNQIKRQQERNKVLLQSINEHKPLVDKLNKTGTTLMKLCKEEDNAKLTEILDSDNSRYNALKNILRNHQNTLEEALQATSQFSDKLEGMLNALSSTADQLYNAEPISAIPDRIQEQINDNKAVLQDLDKRSTALEAVKKAADDVIVKAGNTDEPAVRDIRQKLDRLNGLWETIQKAARHRGKSLEDALAAAERFWEELNAVMKALKELQESLNAQEPPAVEPSAIQQQQEVLQEIKQEIGQTKPEVDHCRQAGQDLMQLCGEPDKPEVKKHIEDLDSAWENVTTLYAKREQNLIDAMEKAMNFHDTLQNLLEFLDTVEDKFSNLGPVGSDIDAVKGQIDYLKDFKMEVDPHMVEIESLNRQAQELMERTSPDQATAIREPLADINRRWDDLLKGIVNRQRGLEKALLHLGQFQHALDELLIWMSKTEKTLDELQPVFGDPQVIEVVLAKLKVLTNDIQAHQSSVNTLNHAGRQLIETNKGSEDANITQNKLGDLNTRWKNLQDRASIRQRELEDALKEAQAFNQEIQDLLLWLSEIDSQLATSKPVGGLPETAKEQLNRFMELYNDLDSNRHKVDSVLQQGQRYLDQLSEGSTNNLRNNLKILKQRSDSVLNKANDRKIKLEIALREALEFHESLQSFVDWLTNAEKYLTNLKPVSRIMKAVMEQIEDHKTFQKDVGSHREIMVNLDKKGTHLKYFSQKQDVILIKNLLISVQHRWERVVSKAAERTRALDHGYKEAKEFHDAWTEIVKWLDEAESTLDSAMHIGNDPQKIKQQLSKHKEFQRILGSKQGLYDNTMKIGRTLKEKCPKTDVPILQNMMDELKKRWNKICTKSVDRQRKLEEALLFSGQFKEAVQALIDWLDKAQNILSEDKSLYGDLDTVTSLMDQHKSFQEELKSRNNSVESVQKTASDLMKTANAEDKENINYQLDILQKKWILVKDLNDQKNKILQEALAQAEKLYKSVHILLEWLSEAEMKLRFIGPLPEDEETTLRQIAEHQKFLQEMNDYEIIKDDTLDLAQTILKKCHPNGISVIRHWITIIQSRWEEVVVWAKQRDQRLQDHLHSLKNIMQLLEDLLAWLILAENNLIALEAEPLPDDLTIIEQLIKDHKIFMDDMTKKQSDVEKVTKAFSSKRQPSQQTQIPTRDRIARDRSHKIPSPAVPKTSTPSKQLVEPHIKHPRARELVEKWRNVWLLAMERQRRLQDKYNYLKELERIKNFDFNEWRRRFLGWMNNKKSRIMDLFKKIDKNNAGKVTKEEFIQGILKSKFPTSRLEMERVADIFDRNGDGYVDHNEYIETLRPEREGRPKTEAEKIQDEVQRQVAKCTCVHRFKVYQVGEGKYRFGDSQKLRLVRILRSTVMVRVGGGWVALDEFLVKNDPCRAKGRTNVELREQFVLAEGVSQSMTPFKSKPSPNSSQSSQSGTPYSRTGSSSAGPITKVRERSERSSPMWQQRASGPGDTSSDISGPSFSETDSYGTNRSFHLTPPTIARAAGGSRPSSRPSSRPPSRAGSDLSAESLDTRKKSSRQRTPSSSSSSQMPAFKGSGTPSRIPSARSESGRGRSKP
ncbi:microtubule-actin cross-linking factor 1, isoforms 1/2/3/4/5-like isoform X3 [Centruroides vittatus]|uniref:microtubule-actin cross-linking factor 1, isoforms 1/2/3/4/5-like isoform X3 n=1 Tax=Centruroides vittatus TaxID=120091 RepID=UPI00350F6689